jgi:hypothetical protein
VSEKSGGVFVVHHNPDNGRYRYASDPRDAIASAKALMRGGEDTWVAGNCHRMIRAGDLLFFKFGGSQLRQEPGIYAAARVTRAPMRRGRGRWLLRYRPEIPLTRRLMQSPIIGDRLKQLVPRSFGASIQAVQARGRAILPSLLSHADTRTMALTHGLLILKGPLDKILARTKTWEIRGKATARRGPIALIESKSGHVVGRCELVDTLGPLSLAELRRNARRTGFQPRELPHETTYAWVMRSARRLPSPIPYRHPMGAVIWVRLEPSVVRCLERSSQQAR